MQKAEGLRSLEVRESEELSVGHTLHLIVASHSDRVGLADFYPSVQQPPWIGRVKLEPSKSCCFGTHPLVP